MTEHEILAVPLSAAPTKPRYVFIDAMRGVAALGVMLLHLYNNSELQKPLSHMFPTAAIWLCNFGARGVQVFFVISGFVIAHSLRKTLVTPRSAVSFAIRRQIRLDPAYWVVLAFAVASMWIAAFHHHFDPHYPHPGLRRTLLNAVYLQCILGTIQVVGVAWTLCLEIQFYLFFLVVLFIGQRLGRCHPIGLAPFVVAITALASAAAHVAANKAHPIVFIDPPWFIYTWYMFALGTLAYWAVEGHAPRPLFLAVAVAILACGGWFRWDRMLAADVTAIVFFALGVSGHLQRWTLGRVFQYLGAISYSLYLVHDEVLRRFYKTVIHWTGLSPWPAVLWFFVAALLSVGVAHVFHLVIERPTRNLASRLKPLGERTPPSPDPIVDAAAA